MNDLVTLIGIFRSIWSSTAKSIGRVAIFLLLGVQLQSQTVTVPAANTNTGSVNDPLGTYYGYERSAMIYTAAQIGSTGNIASVGFYVNSLSTPGQSTNVRIYMKMRTTLMTANTTYATEISGATLVYGPTTIPASSFVTGRWFTIPLTTPFNYTGGTNNLEVIVETNATGAGNEGSTGKQFRYSSPGNSTSYQYWNADNSAPTGTGTRANTRPNIQLNFCNTSIAPTGVTGNSVICNGSSTTLTSTGGSLGTDAVDVWYSGACGADIYTDHWSIQNYTPNQTTVNSVNGVLNLTSTGGDPWLEMYNIGSFGSLSTNRYINIRYRVISGTPGTAEIFFLSASNPGAAQVRAVSGSLVTGGQWQVLSLDMGSNANWTTIGNITGWRFDWSGASGVNMEIDFISLGSQPIIGSGSSITVSPTSTTTYYTAKNGACGLTTCASATVNVVTGSVAPTSISGTSTICQGDPTTLTSVGGSLGTDAEDIWYTGACPTDAFTQEWITQPYAGIANFTTNSVVNGILNVTSTTNDPVIEMYGLGTFDPNTYRYVNVRYRVTSVTPADNMQIFWTNSLYGAANGNQVRTQSISSPQNVWQTVSIDMANTALGPGDWYHSNVTGWRFDWTTASGVTMDIDFITLSTHPILGVGSSITVSPSSSTTYYTNKKGACNTTACASQLVTVNVCGTPTISGVSPAVVCFQSGATITITGTNLSAASVTINGVAATVTSNTPTQIQVTLPNGVAVGGPYDVYVSNSGGNVTSTGAVTVNPLATAGTLQYNGTTQNICAGSSISCSGATPTYVAPTNGGAGTLTVAWFVGEETSPGVYGNWKESTPGTPAGGVYSSVLNTAAGGGNGNALSLSNYNPRLESGGTFSTNTKFRVIRGAYSSNCGWCVGGCQLQTFDLNIVPLPTGGSIATVSYCPGGNGTATVTGVSGATQYAWSLGSLSGSSTTASIGVSGGTTNSYQISVTPQNVVGTVTCSAASVVTGNVNVLSTANDPGQISVASAICQNGSATITNVTPASTGTPASAGPNYYFYWQRTTAPVVSWTMYDGPTSNVSSALPVAVTGTPGSYLIARNSEFGCAGQTNNSLTVDIPITVRPLPTAAVSGSTTACPSANSNITFNLTGTAPWSLTYTDGVTPVTVSGINSSPYIAVVAPATTRTYTATALSDAYCSAIAGGLTGNAVVTVSGVPAQPSVITGPTSICGGTSQNYSVTNVSGVTYNWSLPSGWTQTAGGTTNAISLTTGTSTNTITVTPSNSCGNGTARTLSVTITGNSPSNNLCSNATAISAAGSISGNFTCSTFESPFTSYNDVWYSFTPVCGGSYTATLSGLPDDKDLALFSACGTTSATSTSANSGSSNESITFTATASTTYLFRVYDYAGTGGNFNFSISAAPVPAQPSAITGTLNPEIGTSQVYSVTNVSGVTYTWSFPATWNITAGQGTNTVTVTVGTQNGNISVTPSNACGSGTARTATTTIPQYRAKFISASTGSSPWCTGTSRTITVTIKNNGINTWNNSGPDVNIGVKWNGWSDYHVRTDANGLASGQTQTFSLVVEAKNATAGPVYGTNLVAGSNNLTFDLVAEGCFWFASNATGGTCTGATVSGNAVYNPGAITIADVPAQPSTISGFTGVCQGSSQTYNVTSVAGVTYNWVLPSGWIQTGGGTSNSITATAGNTGTISVTPSNSCGNGTARTLAVTVSNAPSNDACAAATGLTIGAAAVTGNVACAAAGSGACTGSANYDVWYSFTPVCSGNHVVTLVGSTSFDPVIQVYSSCGGAAINNTGSASCIDASGSGGTETSTYSLVAGNTYYVRVYDYESSGTAYPASTTFTISVSDACPPANDVCATAINLSVNAAATNGTIANASSGLGACVGNADYDVWYKFTTGSCGGAYTVFLDPSAQFDGVFQLYSGNCSGLGIISGASIIASNTDAPNIAAGCIDFVDTNPDDQPDWATYNLSANTTYYLRVYDVVNSGTAYPPTPGFTIAVTSTVNSFLASANAGTDVTTCTLPFGLNGSITGTPQCGGHIGTNDDFDGDYGPFSTAWEDSRKQYLYRASDLLAAGIVAGNINSIGFYIRNFFSNQTMNGFTVKLKNTTTTDLNSFTYEAGLTTAYAGSYSITTAGLNTINLTSPFSWDGSSNLLVEICYDNSSYTLNNTVLLDLVSYTGIRGNYEDGITGCSDSYVYFYDTYIPLIRFGQSCTPVYTWSGPGTISPNPSSNPSVSSLGTYTLSVNLGGCSITDQVVVGSTTIPAVPSVSNNGPVCSGSTAQLIAAGLAPGGQVAVLPGTSAEIQGTAFTSTLDNHTIEFWVIPNKNIVIHPEINSGVSGSLAAVDNHYSFAIAPYQFGGSGCTPATVGVGVSVGNNGIEVVQHGPCHFPVTLSYPVAITGWTHIAVVHINNVPYLYVNGNLAKVGVASLYPTFPNSATSFVYGYFNGSIDNVRVWSTSRTIGQLQTDMFLETPTVPTGLLGHYPYNGNAIAAAGPGNTNNGASFNAADYFTYTWTGTNAPVAGIAETQTTGVLATTPTNYTVVASAGGCVGIISAVNAVTVDQLTISVAGADQDVCATTATLAGNTPATGVGTWTLISGAGTITSANSPTSGLTALGAGANTFRWTLPNGSCADSQDDVIITRSDFTTAAAGPDQTICATTATLAGNTPATGVGTWTLISGSGTITSSTSPTSGLTALGAGANTFRWTLPNGSCADSQDDVIITRDQAITTLTATASPNPVCSNDILTLTASNTGGTNITWSWSGPAGFSAVTQNTTRSSLNEATHEGVYTVKAINACHPGPGGLTANTASVNIHKDFGFVSSVSVNPNPVCEGSSITLTANFANGTPTDATYSWTGPNSFSSSAASPTRSNMQVADGGSYDVTVSNACYPGGQSNGTIASLQPVINATIAVDECMGTSPTDRYYLLVTGSGGTGTLSYSGTPVISVGNQKVYYEPAGSTVNVTITDQAAPTNCSKTVSVTAPSGHPVNIPLTANVTSSVSVNCYDVDLDRWVTFRDNSNNAILSINDNINGGAVNNNLGLVNVTVYKDAVEPTTYTTGPNCQTFTDFKAMKRHFTITTTNAPTVGEPVGVRLYFTQAEADELKAATLGNNSNAPGLPCTQNDDFSDNTGLTDLFVTKYSGPNEDNLYTNNLSSGTYRVFGTDFGIPGSPDGPLTKAPNQFSSVFSGGPGYHYVQLQVTEFSEFWLHGSYHGAPLPVEMIYFQAEAVNNSYIQLTWATAIEIDNDGFIVERSVDAQTWSNIGWVEGHDNATTQHDYSFNDYNVEPNVRYYYRLKQLDNDGDYEYTTIVSEMISTQSTFAVKDFIPNPTMNNTSLIVSSSEEQVIEVKFYDIIGQVVSSSEHSLHKGGNQITFSLEHLSAGTYTAIVTSNNEVYSKKLVVTR